MSGARSFGRSFGRIMEGVRGGAGMNIQRPAFNAERQMEGTEGTDEGDGLLKRGGRLG